MKDHMSAATTPPAIASAMQPAVTSHSCTLLVAEVVGLPLGVGRCRSGDRHCQLLVESHHHTAAPGLFRFQLTDDRGMLLVKRR